MNDNPSNEAQNEKDLESLKKTTQISLEEALSSNAAPSQTGQTGDKESTSPITGIPTHTSPIPQTIRLKRPSTSPLVISQHDITSAPTAVKTVHAKRPSAPAEEIPTVIKKAIPSRPMNETSRIILEIDPQTTNMRQKTAPIPAISQLEPTPAPKTIRLKRPSGVVPVSTPEAQPAPAEAEAQMAKKSETAKIELPKGAEFEIPTTQRKTIKIKRTDRNVIPRTVILARQPEAKPTTAVPKKEEAAAPVRPAPILPSEEPLPVFSILAGLAVVCLVLLTYLLTSQAFGPKLILPIPGALF